MPDIDVENFYECCKLLVYLGYLDIDSAREFLAIINDEYFHYDDYLNYDVNL